MTGPSGDDRARRRRARDDWHDLDPILIARRARQRRRPRRRVGRRLLLAAVLLLVLMAGAGAAIGVGASNALNSSCTLHDLRPLRLGENSFVFASDGSLLGVVPSSRNRQPLKLNAISPWLPKATVAIEDRRFWKHGALDYQGILRAAVADVRAGHVVEGGSTITQELVRNLYIGKAQRTFSRKIREACLARRLASRWSKSQILAAYVNEVFYGRHAYGAEAAAQTYFSTHARSLTLTQAALLAGLPQAPSVYDPMLHPRDALLRRNDVLRAMLVARYITPAQYASAVRAPLAIKPGKLYSFVKHPNFFGFAETQLIKAFGAKRVEAGGLRVRTTVDPKLQEAATQAAASVLREPTDPDAAVVAIDPSTGAIKAMVPFTHNRPLQFNLASQGHRQAGSSFKPFVLATAINQGISVYSTFSGPPALTIQDPACATNNVLWDVHNYADENGGTMNLIDATANSVNTIFAQLVVAVGPENVVQTAHAMGITSPLKPVCSITLGTQAVSPLEMTDAYATLAAQGVHHPAQSLARVRGPDGRLLGQLVKNGDQAIPASTANLVTYVLQGVIEHGTGTAAAIGRPAAGKTGTAEDFQDAWFCGYVPQLATCVWVGYPKREVPMYGIEGFGSVFGGSLPAMIWQRFMSAAVAKLPVEYFPAAYFGGHTISGYGYGYTTTTTSSYYSH